MKLDIPIEIGDPVLVIKFNQHDGYWIESKQFDWYLVPAYLDGEVFRTAKEAEFAVKKLNEGLFKNEF